MNRRNGFTLIEMLVAISILAFFSTLTLLEFGFVQSSNSEFDQFISFARTQHASVIRSGSSRQLLFDPGEREIRAYDSKGELVGSFQFQELTIRRRSRNFDVRLTSVGVRGPDQISFSSPTAGLIKVEPHTTLTFRELKD